jgi:hypothetical protein
MDHGTKAFIEAAGGYRSVAGRLNEKPTTVHNWTRASYFPASQYRALTDLAREMGIDPPPPSLFTFKPLPTTGDAA